MPPNKENVCSRNGPCNSYECKNNYPPMSRLFIICDKLLTKREVSKAFAEYGEIEEVYMVKNKQTRRNSGFAYVKYTRTLSAANAIEGLDGKYIGSAKRTLKVLVAADRDECHVLRSNEEMRQRYLRLFIVIPQRLSQGQIRRHFAQFGEVKSLAIIKDHATGRERGLGYVRFGKFKHAAMAYEQCDPEYRALFANPNKPTFHEHSNIIPKAVSVSPSETNSSIKSRKIRPLIKNEKMEPFLRMANVLITQPTRLAVIVSSCLTQAQLLPFFDIIPGMMCCEIVRHLSAYLQEAVVIYDNPEAAIYAKKKLHGFEYPLGKRLVVRFGGISALNDIIAHRPVKPQNFLALKFDKTSENRGKQQLFFVLSGSISLDVLRNVFSLWIGFLGVYMLSNINCGYVVYAQRPTAMNVIKSVNGTELYGQKIIIMEAKEY